MKANKTQPTQLSVAEYFAAIENEEQRDDAVALAALMEAATGLPPVLWGTAIIGFGTYHYVYESGREGDTPIISFAVRKNALTLYGVMFYEHNEDNMQLAANLGPHTHGKGCLYIKRLQDIDVKILREMIANAYRHRTNKK